MTDQTIDEIRRARKIISDEIGSGLDDLVSRYASFESRFRRPALTPKDRRNRVRAILADDPPHTT